MNRMKSLREELGISMMEAARRLSMPYTTYVNYEKGEREPNSETLIEIANFFGTSIDYLLGKSSIKQGEQESPSPRAEDGRNVVKIAGRDGSFVEKHLTDEQLAALKTIIDQLPPADL